MLCNSLQACGTSQRCVRLPPNKVSSCQGVIVDSNSSLIISKSKCLLPLKMKNKWGLTFSLNWVSCISFANTSGFLESLIFNLKYLSQDLIGLLKYIIFKIKIFLEHFDRITNISKTEKQQWLIWNSFYSCDSWFQQNLISNKIAYCHFTAAHSLFSVSSLIFTFHIEHSRNFLGKFVIQPQSQHDTLTFEYFFVTEPKLVEVFILCTSDERSWLRMLWGNQPFDFSTSLNWRIATPESTLF